MQRIKQATHTIKKSFDKSAIEGYLKDFRKMSAAVMRLNVRMLKGLRGKPFEEARLMAERVFLEELMPLEDVREGIASFMEKRRPVWQNR